MFLRAVQIAFAVSISLLILVFLAMAFFYGFGLIVVTSDNNSLDDSYTIGNDLTTILPGMQRVSFLPFRYVADLLWTGRHF